MARHRGVGAAPRRHRLAHGHDGPAPRRPRRRRARRADHRQRVRRRQPHPHQAARRHAQPVAARQDTRRLVGWIGVGGGRRDLPDRHRRRRRRFDPHPGRVHRPGRTEGHVRAHPTRPPRRVRQPHRVDGVHGPIGARHGPLVRRHATATTHGPAEPAAGRGLGGRSGHPPRRRCAAHASPWSTTGAAPSCHRSCGSCWTRQRPP